MVGCSEYMEEPLFVNVNDTLARARNIMIERKVDRLLVEDEGRLVGILTLKDIARRLFTSSPAWRRRPIDEILVGRIMSQNLKTLPSDAQIAEAARLMIAEDIGSIPLLDADQVIGLVTRIGICRYFIEHYEGMYKVRDIMNKRFPHVKPTHTVAHVIKLMDKERSDWVAVIDPSDKLLGIISTETLTYVSVNPEKTEQIISIYAREGREYKYLPLLTAEDIMDRNYPKVAPNGDAVKAAEILIQPGKVVVPVVSNEILRGGVSRKEIVRCVLNESVKYHV